MVSRTQRTASVCLSPRKTCEQIQMSVKVLAGKDKTAKLSRKVSNSVMSDVNPDVKISVRRSSSSKSCNKSFKTQLVAPHPSLGHGTVGLVTEIQHSWPAHPQLWQDWANTLKVRTAMACYIILKMLREHNDGPSLQFKHRHNSASDAV